MRETAPCLCFLLEGPVRLLLGSLVVLFPDAASNLLGKKRGWAPIVPQVLNRSELRGYLHMFPRFVSMSYDVLGALSLGP
jgi:hypothetical protein